MGILPQKNERVTGILQIIVNLLAVLGLGKMLLLLIFWFFGGRFVLQLRKLTTRELETLIDVDIVRGDK